MPALGYLSLLIIWSLIAGSVLVLSVLLTNPLQIGPAGVTLWFLMFLSGGGAILALVLYTAKTFLQLHASSASRLRYSWRQGLLLSGWLTSLLALSSLRQLSVRDAILLGLILVIVEGYFRFRWP